MNLDQMQKDFELTNYLIFKYNLGFSSESEVDSETMEFRMPN